jgi:glutamate synthase (NADPH/NADH) large chain
MTGGVVYLLDCDPAMLNRQYVSTAPLEDADVASVQALLREHLAETASPAAEALLASFDPARFSRIATCVSPERLE